MDPIDLEKSALISLSSSWDKFLEETSDALTSGLGTLTATGHSNIAVTGVYGTGHVNQLLVWGIIDDDQDPNWTGVSDSQDPSWTGVSDSQDPNWKDIAA